MRLFFAAFPDDETQRLIASAADALLVGDGARLVPCENYHLTLAFVGEVSDTQAASLRTIGSLEVPAFTIRFDAYEHWQKAEVIVLTVSECPPALHELQCKLCRELTRHDVASETRPFEPHVTIARKVVQAPVQQAMSGFLWPVTAFQLVRSVKSRTSSTYTVLGHWSLLDKPARAE